MSPTTLENDVQYVCDLANSKRIAGKRTIIGVAGPPASGKSTLAEAVVRCLNQEENAVPVAALLPMDGYHLDNRLLESRGLLARKGAPETFDAHGFCDAVQKLSSATRESFHPKFDRQMDLAIANSIAIHPDTPVVVVEGNYLLLKAEPWATLKDVFSATVFVSPTIEELRDRLQQRWIKHGLDPTAAMQRATGNDLPNAELVLNESREADVLLNQNYTEFGVRYAY
ncbi:nucleoside triphosphate hydrolase [Cognatiyoonia sp.]|uniref:nucleoside triphosphate hydrolase n=1 Tax=Cognatiyoonia sp. TaxID=2211652 RepID=UPI003F696A00